jgi:hypothetical protein
MKDGRSSAPPLPDDYYWILFTRNVNQFLGSNYTIEQVQQMRSDQKLLLELWMQNA